MHGDNLEPPEGCFDDDWVAPENPDPPFQRGDHVELAERLLKILREKGETVFTDSRFYRYSSRGIFEILDDSVLSRVVQGFAGQLAPNEKGKLVPLKISRAAFTGARAFAIDNAADPEFFTRAAAGIAFEGCFVRVDANGITKHEHSAEHRARFIYPFGFVEREPTRFLEFFAQVFRDDADRDAKVALLQEYLGVSLLGLATRFQKALFLQGDGSNGKSVFIEIAEGCMPPGSVCSIPPQDIHQEYRRALLAGKLLNIVSEVPEREILESEPWKAAIDGSPTTGRPIREAPFTFKPIAGHVYSCNRLPGTTDQTHGFWRRPIPVTFNRIFAEHEQNKNLATEILGAEKPLIVAWFFAGAQRALRQGYLTVPASSDAAKRRWQLSADQVLAFSRERCERLLPDAHWTEGTKAMQLYNSYRYWATEHGHRNILAANTFADRMRLIGLPSTEHRDGSWYPVRIFAQF